MRQRQGGISRLFSELIGEFDEAPSLDVTALMHLRWTPNRHAATSLQHRGVRAVPSWIDRKVLYPFAWVGGTRPSMEADLIHHTYYSRRFFSKRRSIPIVSTIHDMIPELFAGTDLYTGSHLSKREYVLSSDLVICVSESTRADLMRLYGEVTGRVVVVPNAVGPGFAPGLPRLPGLPARYGIFVGARGGYKDFALLPRACELLRASGIAMPFVVVGAPFTDRERSLLLRHGVADRFHQMSLSDLELRCAYSNATLLVQTSRYEGFGMTPLEGMASGIPVVIADAASMPEVGGSVARYFVPGDPISLSERIAELLLDDVLRAELGVLGVQQASRFTLRGMAEGTAAAYRSVLNN